MNKENIKGLINQMRGYANTKELSALINHFEQFIDLAEKKEEVGNEALDAARNQCFESISTVLSALGLTPETMQQHFENPSNFSAEEWQKVQNIQEEYLGTHTTLSNKRIKIRGAKV